MYKTSNFNFRNNGDSILDKDNSLRIKKLKLLVVLYGVIIITIYILLNVDINDSYDPFFKEQWNLNDSISGINAEKMWDYEKHYIQERPIIIAIIDTGVDFNNKELEGRMWKGCGENSTHGQASVSFDSYHGTICAEIITANHNSYGIEGIASSLDLKIMSLKTLSSQNSVGGGSINSVINAIKFAEDNGAHICNLSFGTDVNSPELYKAVSNSKMLFITSAGNATSFRGVNIDKAPYYPASFNLENLISVTCIDKYSEFSKFVNYGKESVDIAAPGIDIPIVQYNGELGFVSGTSFAVPHVTGVAAVLYAFDKDLNACQCKKYICSTVQKKESLYNRCKTGGTIDGYSALKTLMEFKKEGEKM